MLSVIAGSIIKRDVITCLRNFINISSSETSNKVAFLATLKLHRKYSTDVKEQCGSAITDYVDPEEYFSLPIVPLVSAPVFPVLPSYVKIPEIHMDLFDKKVKRNEPYIGIFMVKDHKNKSKLIKNADDLCSVGMVAKIKSVLHDHNCLRVMADRRITIKDLKNNNTNKDMLIADVKTAHHAEYKFDHELEELASRFMYMVTEIIKLGEDHGKAVETHLVHLSRYGDLKKDPEFLCDFGASIASDSAEVGELQEIIGELDRTVEISLLRNLSSLAIEFLIPKRLRLSSLLLNKNFKNRAVEKTQLTWGTILYDRPVEY